MFIWKSGLVVLSVCRKQVATARSRLARQGLVGASLLAISFFRLRLHLAGVAALIASKLAPTKSLQLVQVAPVELPRESGRQIGRKLPSAKQRPQGAD
ncbi:hypothetical protein NA633_15655 [Pseudomonas stutzeri]|uniref:hypothetical protein n=1 Tax=Stutzerimonas stutzeri TaxID=316 RepID=UPI001184F538|nr:hypothetical protein [Stutzerimonas stutzeri]MCQ4284540.1 hypothetical protein [Stutzerimonas stutzeri]